MHEETSDLTMALMAVGKIFLKILLGIIVGILLLFGLCVVILFSSGH